MSDSVQSHRGQPTRLPSPWDSPGKNPGVGCHFLLQSMKVKSESEVAQSCPTLSDPMDCSLPGSSIHGIFQARVLEWGAIAFSPLSSPHFICIFCALDFPCPCRAETSSLMGKDTLILKCLYYVPQRGREREEGVEEVHEGSLPQSFKQDCCEQVSREEERDTETHFPFSERSLRTEQQELTG